jgi:hypothetical protein
MLQDEGLLADHGEFVTLDGGGEGGHGAVHSAVLHVEGVRFPVGVLREVPAKLRRAAVDGVVVVVGEEGGSVHVLRLAELQVLRVVDPRGPYALRLHCVFAFLLWRPPVDAVCVHQLLKRPFPANFS